jgi:hypothetical protein
MHLSTCATVYTYIWMQSAKNAPLIRVVLFVAAANLFSEADWLSIVVSKGRAEWFSVVVLPLADAQEGKQYL